MQYDLPYQQSDPHPSYAVVDTRSRRHGWLTLLAWQSVTLGVTAVGLTVLRYMGLLAPLVGKVRDVLGW